MGSFDPAKFAGWFDSHAATLVLYARHWLDAGAAEDAVQDVFVRLLAQPRRPDNVKAWLFRAVRNAAISRLRCRKRRRRREARAAERRSNWFEPRPDDLIDGQMVQAPLSDLPADQSECVVLRIWAELTFKEIATVMGVSTPTAFRRYRAALDELRQRMEMSCKNKHI